LWQCTFKRGLRFEWKDELLLQLSHTNAILSPQELADVSEAEMEYAKSLYQEDYMNGQLTNTSLVNSTIAAGLANLTYDELVFAEAAIDSCGNTTDIRNITEILVPERLGGTSSQIVASVSLGRPVDAFFCDANSNQVPDPVLSQGDTIRVCVRLSQNSSYFHLEDIYMMALTQPTTAVTTHYAVYNGNASAVSTKNCQLGLCDILSQVPSRFFGQDSGPVRIVGVALLNLGPQDRRVLAPIEFSGLRQLQTADISRSAFELEAEIIGWTPTNNSNDNSDIHNACVLLLAATTFFIVFLVLWWRRKQEAPRKPFEPMPMQPTPSMKVPEPMRIISPYAVTQYPVRGALAA
jgi:hypothetical protein